MFEALFGGIVGVASGMRHAIEPDHLAAVATLATGKRSKSTRATVRFAATWGLGHALMLLMVSGVLVVTRRKMPQRAGDVFEVLVATMLVGLGVQALVTLRQRSATVPGGSGTGDGSPSRHVHAHAHAADAKATTDHWRRPLVVGLVHGLAGSGALTALTLATISSPWAGLVYVGLYGIGAMLGMALLGGLAGAPLARLARSERAMRALTSLTALVSLLVGLVWGAQAVGRLLGA